MFFVYSSLSEIYLVISCYQLLSKEVFIKIKNFLTLYFLISFLQVFVRLFQKNVLLFQYFSLRWGKYLNCVSSVYDICVIRFNRIGDTHITRLDVQIFRKSYINRFLIWLNFLGYSFYILSEHYWSSFLFLLLLTLFLCLILSKISIIVEVGLSSVLSHLTLRAWIPYILSYWILIVSIHDVFADSRDYQIFILKLIFIIFLIFMIFLLIFFQSSIIVSFISVIWISSTVMRDIFSLQIFLFWINPISCWYCYFLFN